MTAFEEANRAEQRKEVHKYCNLVDLLSLGSASEQRVTANDIRNLMLHMADFEYIREEFRKLYYIHTHQHRDPCR